MASFAIIDADGHVTETSAGLKKYLSPQNRSRPLWSSATWDRSFGGTLGKDHDDPKLQLADMDADGIDVQVVYPTRGLSLSALKEIDLAVDVARAYNEWLAEFCATDSRRLKGVAMVALQDVGAAVKEARRAMEELGHVGIMMPTNVLDQDIGMRQFWPFYEEVERLGVGLGIHGGIRASERMGGRFSTFIAVHTVSFPFECMAALTGLIFAGVPVQFPRLRIAALECCCGWLPFLMDRMDEEFELRGSREAPLLKTKPSEYMKGDQFYYSFELEESMLPNVMERVGEEKLLYASDYPHWDTGWPNTVKKVMSREDITDGQRQKIMCENARRFYGLSVEATPAAVSA